MRNLSTQLIKEKENKELKPQVGFTRIGETEFSIKFRRARFITKKGRPLLIPYKESPVIEVPKFSGNERDALLFGLALASFGTEVDIYFTNEELRLREGLFKREDDGFIFKGMHVWFNEEYMMSGLLNYTWHEKVDYLLLLSKRQYLIHNETNPYYSFISDALRKLAGTLAKVFFSQEFLLSEFGISNNLSSRTMLYNGLLSLLSEFDLIAPVVECSVKDSRNVLVRVRGFTSKGLKEKEESVHL